VAKSLDICHVTLYRFHKKRLRLESQTNPTRSRRYRTHLMKMRPNTALCAWRATPGPRRSGCSVAPVKPGHTRTAQMEVPFTPATTVNLINSGVLF